MSSSKASHVDLRREETFPAHLLSSDILRVGARMTVKTVAGSVLSTEVAGGLALRREVGVRGGRFEGVDGGLRRRGVATDGAVVLRAGAQDKLFSS